MRVVPQRGLILKLVALMQTKEQMQMWNLITKKGQDKKIAGQYNRTIVSWV